MPSIPYESQIDARTGRGGGARLRNAYDANTFGAQSGEALQRAGAEVGQVADQMEAEADRKAKEVAVYKQSTFDFTDDENRVKQTVGEDAEGYKDAIRTAFINKVSEETNSIQDDRARKMTKEALLSQLPKYTEQADNYQQKTMQDTTKMRTNAVLSTNINKVRTDPNYYDTAVKLNSEMIDVYGHKLSQAAREDMRTNDTYNLTKNRFEGLMDGARTPAEIESIQAEMADASWQSKLLPRDFDDVSNKLLATKKAMETKAYSEANAVLTNLEERVKDPTTLIPQEEMAAAQTAAAASGNPNAQVRMARIARDQQIVASERTYTPQQLRSVIDRTKGTSSTALRPDIATAVNDVASRYGISASYLESTITRESAGNPDAKATTSSATGLLQFTDKTFLDLVKDPAVAVALGVKMSTTREEILALRTDPAKAVEAGAILAKQNKNIMEKALGRQVSDVEMYMAHFLGAGEATRFLQTLQTNGDAIAATAFPEAADANKNVFMSKDGKPFTVAQVFNNISNGFSSTVSRVAYDDTQVRQRLLEKMETELKGPNALKYAASVGVITLTPLDEEGAFPARAKALAMASQYYGRQLQPFSTDEEAYIKKTVDEGSVNDTLRMMKDIQTMGPSAARAAFTQLNVKAPAFAHAGQLELSGDPSTARDVIRGYKRQKESPALLSAMQYKTDQATVDFQSVVGPSLSRIPPSEYQAAQEAAVALLVEQKQGALYKGNDYKEAVKKVLGNRIDEVNGEKTLLPLGFKSRDIEKALTRMTDMDYVAMSEQGLMPMHADGSSIDPRSFEDEARLRAVGDDKYYLADSDGSFLWTGRIIDGVPEKYILNLKPERLQNLLDRKVLAEAR